jgi:hypothetical protein
LPPPPPLTRLSLLSGPLCAVVLSPHWGKGTNCDQELLDLKSSLDAAKVPLGYMSFQGAWWFINETAPWCVSEWDHNPGRNYPMTNKEFQDKLQLPLQ